MFVAGERVHASHSFPSLWKYMSMTAPFDVKVDLYIQTNNDYLDAHCVNVGGVHILFSQF